MKTLQKQFNKLFNDNNKFQITFKQINKNNYNIVYYDKLNKSSITKYHNVSMYNIKELIFQKSKKNKEYFNEWHKTFIKCLYEKLYNNTI